MISLNTEQGASSLAVYGIDADDTLDYGQGGDYSGSNKFA